MIYIYIYTQPIPTICVYPGLALTIWGFPPKYCWAILPKKRATDPTDPQAAGHKLAWNSRSRPTSHWSPSPKALNKTDGQATNTTGGVKGWNRKCQKLRKRWLSVSLSDWVDCTIPNAWLSDLFFWLGWSLWRYEHVTSAKTCVHKYHLKKKKNSGMLETTSQALGCIMFYLLFLASSHLWVLCWLVVSTILKLVNGKDCPIQSHTSWKNNPKSLKPPTSLALTNPKKSPTLTSPHCWETYWLRTDPSPPSSSQATRWHS